MSRAASQLRARWGRPLAIPWSCALALAATAALPPAHGAESADKVKPWEVAAYAVRVLLAANDPGDLGLEARLARYIRQRSDSALRPLWKLDLRAATTPAERAACRELRETPWNELSDDERGADKLLWLNVKRGPVGYTLTCREFDAYTRRWGPVQSREVAQRASLEEAAFRMLTDAFSPLARVESADGDAQAQLIMKGGALPRPEGPDLLTAPGDVYLPILRRTGRGGELVEGGVTPLPWTYLVAEKPQDSGWLAGVETALRQPLAGRRRTSIEQLAIALRSPPEPARVRFFARSNREQGLAGYEVYQVLAEGGEPELLGLTDRDGVFTVPARDKPATLLLRSDGQVLAKLVVAPGTAPVLDAPIADDVVRLAAQGEVQSVREELIDVVARRAILIARIEALLKKGDATAARELMDELNDLPTSTVFRSRIDEVASRLQPSDDPRVKQTVDGLFTQTRELLGRFLDARVITDLQARVNEALHSGS